MINPSKDHPYYAECHHRKPENIEEQTIFLNVVLQHGLKVHRIIDDEVRIIYMVDDDTKTKAPGWWIEFEPRFKGDPGEYLTQYFGMAVPLLLQYFGVKPR
jgi:hypothetical protein